MLSLCYRLDLYVNPSAFLSFISFYDIIYHSSHTLCNAVYAFSSQSINGIRQAAHFYLEADIQQHDKNYTKIAGIGRDVAMSCSFCCDIMATLVTQYLRCPNCFKLLFSYILYFFLRHWRNIHQLVQEDVVQRILPNTESIALRNYRQVSNIRRTLVGNKIINHSYVVGASPVGAAPTTSSLLT